MSAVAEGRGLIHKGDKTTTGGVVTSGVGSVIFFGEGVTQIGMVATCPSCKKGQGKIIPLKPLTVIVDGVQVALHGDIVACGCPYGSNTLIASSSAMSFSTMSDGNMFAAKSNANTQEMDATYQSVADSLGGSYVGGTHASSLQSGSEPLSEPNDIDDVYIIFSDEKTDIKTFARDVYQTDSNEVVQHIIKLNPHLKRTFHFLVKGMPIVVSPWKTVHPDEVNATSQVSELAELFFTLSDEQQEWFSVHHEEFASVILTSAAMPNATIYEVDEDEVEESNFTNQMIASVGSGVVGMKTQADRLQKEFQRFESYSKYVGESTQGITGDRLKSNPDYKQWSKQRRIFQSEIQKISTQFGAPNYIKNIQAKKIGYYLNVGKKQIYKAKDFSKAVSGIEMTALYKKSMEFSKLLGRAAWVATIFGVRDNFMDIAKVCAKDDGFSEACVRAGVKNSFSIAINVAVGEGIGYLGTKYAPTTKGLSIVPMVAGLYFWGLYGGDVSNSGGDGVEYLVFDAHDDVVEFVSSTVNYIESQL